MTRFAYLPPYGLGFQDVGCSSSSLVATPVLCVHILAGQSFVAQVVEGVLENSRHELELKQRAAASIEEYKMQTGYKPPPPGWRLGAGPLWFLPDKAAPWRARNDDPRGREADPGLFMLRRQRRLPTIAKLFAAADADRSGTLSRDEVVRNSELLAKLKMTAEEAGALFDDLDKDGSGFLSHKEARAAMGVADMWARVRRRQQQQPTGASSVNGLFDALDADHGGHPLPGRGSGGVRQARPHARGGGRSLRPARRGPVGDPVAPGDGCRGRPQGHLGPRAPPRGA